MKYELKNVELLAGINLPSAKAGETAEVQNRGFFTPQNFDKYYNLLDIASCYYLNPYLKNHSVASIENFLIFIDAKTKTANIYINEDIIAECVCKRGVNKGQALTKNDIAGFTSIKIKDINFNETNGVIFYFSQGWKNGVYFDLSPITDSNIKLDNLEYELGQAYQLLLFAEYEKFNKINKDSFYETGWFPFIALQGAFTENLIDEFLQDNSVENSENKILDEFSKKETLNNLIINYKENEYLRPHLAFIEKGIERFLDDDWMSCINNIWPRIEGILRYLYNRHGRFSQGSGLEGLKDILLNENLVPEIYFPAIFKEYMLNFYFKNFDFEKQELDLSRHTIGHGVSIEETYDKKNCILAFLIINQLYYYSKFVKRN
jgi:hypothetical protein